MEEAPSAGDPIRSGYIDDFGNHPLDVNGDGYVDIVACAWFSKKCLV
jgi:hypothetical protein